MITAWGELFLKLCTFVSAYERSLIALNQEAFELEGRIARIERKCDGHSGSRLASRLALYKHQLRGLRGKHRGAACWVSTVARPVFSIIGKRLGAAYHGIFSQEGNSHASMRFFHSSLGADCSLVLNMKLAQLCTEPFNEAVSLQVKRSIVSPVGERFDEDLSLETTISDVLTPLRLV